MSICAMSADVVFRKREKLEGRALIVQDDSPERLLLLQVADISEHPLPAPHEGYTIILLVEKEDHSREIYAYKPTAAFTLLVNSEEPI